jgi:hypothetical protein
MKPNPFFTTVSLSVIGCIYLVQLNNSAENFSKAVRPVAVSVEKEPVSVTTTSVKPLLSIFPTTEVTLNPKARSRAESATKRTHFTIDNSISNRVEGNEGTQLYFPAYCFVDAKGNTINGNVDIELDECYGVADMLNAKLSTTSGNRLLETAGMVNIKAISDGKPVFIKEGAAYNIYFPRNGNEKDDFRLFYGAWTDSGIIDWMLAANDAPIKEEIIDEEEWFAEEDELATIQPGQSLLSDGQACFIQIEKSHIRRGYKINNMDYFNWRLKNGQTLNQWFVSNFNPDLDMLEAFCEKGYRSEIHFKVDRTGAFHSYYVWNSSASREYDRVLANFLKTMPPLELEGLMHNYTYDHSCILTFSSMIGNDRQNFVRKFKAAHRDELTNPLQKVDAAALDYFVYSSTELGWINCDRFYESDQPMVDFYVFNPPSASGSVSMIFDDINSIVKGIYENNQIVFRDIPANQRVRLVGIDVKGDAPIMCMVQAKTEEKVSALTAYRPFSITELEKAFSKQPL